MFGFDPLIVAGMAAAIFIGGIVKGITGIGLPVVTMVIVVNFVSPQTALALIVLSIVVTNAWQSWGTGSPLPVFTRFWPMIVPFIIFLYVGSRIVSSVEPTMMFLLMGAAVLIFSGSQLWRPRAVPLGPVADKVLGPIAGITGGLLGGISTIWGPPMMMYMFMLHLPKDEWVRTIAVVWMIGAVPLTVFYIANGVLNADTAPLSMAATVPGMLGILLGEKLRRQVNEQLFRKVLLIALFIVGLNLVRRALF